MSLQLPFNPIDRGTEVEQIVMRDDRRLYFRFRPGKVFGGDATADCVGCTFLCAYCWNFERNLDTSRYQDFYSPQAAAARLLFLAQRNHLSLFRISGAEPILGEKSFRHILEMFKILVRFRPGTPLVLDTNGLFLGFKPELIEFLKYLNIKVRVGIKGINEESFQSITGAQKDYFELPLIALRELQRRNIFAWPALMADFFPKKDIVKFQTTLRKDYTRAQLEIEHFKAFPSVVEHIKQRQMQFQNFTCDSAAPWEKLSPLPEKSSDEKP